MRRGVRTAIAVGACGVLAGVSAACGAGMNYSEKTGKDAGAELVRLRGLLPKAQELPDGFSAQPGEAWKSPFRPAGRDCRLVFAMAGGSAPQWAPESRVDATYAGEELGELAGVGLASYTVDGAEHRFEELTEALNGCPVARSSRPGRGTSLRVSSLELEAFGDDVQAKRLRGRLDGYPYEMHVVFARVGGTLVSLVHTGLADVDVRRTQQFARFLVERATP
ncbi:hypothetical protein OHA77_10045 [Streptosporangium sp. NBC_01639]|uniref:hypothetical protein n=1 Tax=unclassified Streptosporangium TaxID=2632669 RepID=UPI002DDA62EC|nr:hypothetical protein [Streptosporangium sp. NBC_01756]WSC84519.1 hypothetical protein OIE48_29635 [Streptosporangium sp. NBC_01756]WTD56849.1 hypothetical protein OHA77_10045 [Streptosporangium sp. NBC_01639]